MLQQQTAFQMLCLYKHVNTRIYCGFYKKQRNRNLYNNAAENGEPQPQNKSGRLTTLCATMRLKNVYHETTGNRNPRAKEATIYSNGGL